MSPSAMKRSPGVEDPSLSPPPTKRSKTSNISSKSVINFFTPTSQKPPLISTVRWTIINDTLLTGHYTPPPPTPPVDPGASGPTRPFKIAAFDLDSTLITPASGLVYPRDASDWKWLFSPSSTIPARLRSLAAEGYVLVVFSNQAGIGGKPPTPSMSTHPSKVSVNGTAEGGGSVGLKGKKRLVDWKTKLAAVMEGLGVECRVYAAMRADGYRKPRTGMWDCLLEDLARDYEVDDGAGPKGGKGEEVEVDLALSFFVGDAAGRIGGKGSRKDHSCSDRNFATNIRIVFHTPEEFFLGREAEPWSRGHFDPKQSLVATTDTPTFIKTHDLEIVMFCGSPGAGKSTFYWTHLQPLGYERVNQDILKSRDRCLRVAESSIKDNKVSVAVDNTNADESTRSYWVNLARKLEVPIRCVHFTASTELAQHNDTVRALNGVETNPEHRTILPKAAFAGFQSRYRAPKLEEGFEEIIKMDFNFAGSEEQKQSWSRYWT